MKKNTNRFPRIRGRIFENEDTNVDEHIADSKFLINADACGCSAKDIKDTLEGDGLSVSVSGKWITVRTTSEIDAKEAAKSIKKVCKGKYGSFVVNDEKSHNKAAHNEFIKVDESEKPIRKKINTENMNQNIQKKICEGLINYFKQTNVINESESNIVDKVRSNKKEVLKFIETYKLFNSDSAVLESLDSLKRWINSSSINESRTPSSMRNRMCSLKMDKVNKQNHLLNEAVNIIYGDFTTYMNENKVELPKLFTSKDIKNEMQQYKTVFEQFMDTDIYKLMSEDKIYGKYIEQVYPYLYEGAPESKMKEHFENRINESKQEKIEKINESNQDKINTINKVEGYFIGKGKISGLVNKSVLLNATINEGIRPLIESEKDVKQKQLLESFETWALMNGKSLINESELIDLNEGSNVDANTRKQLFESAIDNMINSKTVKQRRSKNIERIKKYL